MGFLSKIWREVKRVANDVVDVVDDVITWAEGLLNPKMPDAPDGITGVLLNTAASNASLPVIYGTRNVGGSRVFMTTGGDKNKYLYIILVLGEGAVTAVRDIEINSKPLADFGSKARINIHLGADNQAADANFVAELPNWTAQHTLSGVAYLACRFEYDSDLFSGVPTVTAVVDGRALFDPRTGITAFSNNHALVTLDYLRNRRYGVAVADAEINFEAFKRSADICDEVSASSTNSSVMVKRWACNYVLSTDKTRLENVKYLVSACRGFLPYQNGQYALTIVNDDSVVFDFDEGHIVGEISIQPPSKRSRNNRVIVKFVNPDRNWKEDEVAWPADEALYQQFLAEDNYIEMETSLTLENITNAHQAMDLARQACLESRRSTAVSFTATQEALSAYVGRVVSLSYGALGFDKRLFRVESRDISSEVTIQVSLVEFDAEIYPWADLPDLDDVPSVSLPDPLNLPIITGLAFSPADYNSVLCGVLSWDESPTAYVDRYRVEVVNKSSGVLVFATTVSSLSVQVPNMLEGDYQAIVRGISVLSRTPAASVDFSFSVPALDTPTNLEQVGYFDTALTLAWHGSNSPAFARYQIRLIDDVGTVLKTFTSTEPRYVIELATFESMDFPRDFIASVAAVNVAGVVSDYVSISINKVAPATPQSVNLWEGVNQAELIYTLPEYANGVSVWLDTNEDAERTSSNLVYRGNDLRTTLSGLTPETMYYIWMACFDAFGDGPVASLSFNTLADAVAQTLNALDVITDQLQKSQLETIGKVDALETVNVELTELARLSIDKVDIFGNRLNKLNKLDKIAADAILESIVKTSEIEQKQAVFEHARARLTHEQTLLADEDLALAELVTKLDAEFEDNKSSVSQQLTTLANADQTIAQSVADLDAEFNDNKSSVSQQLTTLANADQTIAQSVTDLNTEFEDNKSSVGQQLTALANADQTIAQSVTDLNTEFEDNKSSVSQQLTALANADQTIAQSVTDLNTEFEDNKSSVGQQLSTLADADQTIAQSVTDLNTEFEDNKSSVSQQLTALANADQTIAQSVNQLKSTVNNNAASVEEYQRTAIGYCVSGEHKTSAECAAAGHTWVTSPLAEALQRALIEVADEDGVISTAQAGQLFQTLVNQTGELQATASLFATVKDQLAGLFVNVGQSGSDMQLLADKFTFKTANGSKTPLQIVGETLELVNVVVRSSLNINNKALIDSDGTAYFEDGSFRGHVEATSGSFSGHVEADSGSFKGHVEATSGSIKNLTASNVVIDESCQVLGTVTADRVIGSKVLIATGSFGVGNIGDMGDSAFTVKASGYVDTNYAISGWGGSSSTYIVELSGGGGNGGGFSRYTHIPAQDSWFSVCVDSVMEVTPWAVKPSTIFFKYSVWTRYARTESGATMTWRLYELK
jgi:hypothetical protein